MPKIYEALILTLNSSSGGDLTYILNYFQGSRRKHLIVTITVNFSFDIPFIIILKS